MNFRHLCFAVNGEQNVTIKDGKNAFVAESGKIVTFHNVQKLCQKLNVFTYSVIHVCNTDIVYRLFKVKQHGYRLPKVLAINEVAVGLSLCIEWQFVLAANT